MSRVWQLQEAKNKFSEVVDEALSSGPQVKQAWCRNSGCALL